MPSLDLLVQLDFGNDSGSIVLIGRWRYYHVAPNSLAQKNFFSLMKALQKDQISMYCPTFGTTQRNKDRMMEVTWRIVGAANKTRVSSLPLFQYMRQSWILTSDFSGLWWTYQIIPKFHDWETSMLSEAITYSTPQSSHDRSNIPTLQVYNRLSNNQHLLCLPRWIGVGKRIIWYQLWPSLLKLLLALRSSVLMVKLCWQFSIADSRVIAAY